MKWDYEKGLPIPGTYQQKERHLERLFFSGRYQNQLGTDPVLGVLTILLEDNLVHDRNLANHYRDIISGHLRIEHYPEICCRLFFCDKEEDIWDIVIDGYGSPDSFLFSYGGYRQLDLEAIPIQTASKARQKRFCKYVQDIIPDIRPKLKLLNCVAELFSPEDFCVLGMTGD